MLATMAGASWYSFNNSTRKFPAWHRMPSFPPLSDPKLNELRDIVVKHNVVIFSKPQCPYCVRAKQLFDELNVNFVEIDLETIENSEQLTTQLRAHTGWKTVPQIFVNHGEFLGGCDGT